MKALRGRKTCPMERLRAWDLRCELRGGREGRGRELKAPAPRVVSSMAGGGDGLLTGGKMKEADWPVDNADWLG